MRGHGEPWLIRLDLQLEQLADSRAIDLAEGVSLVVSWPVWTALVLAATVGLWRAGRTQQAVLLLLADLSADLAALVAKWLVDRTPLGSPSRGLDLLLNGALFPSGHIVRATVVVGLVVIVLVPRPSTWARVAIPTALAFLIALGWARVASHAHLPTDVLGGYLLGAAWLELCLALDSLNPIVTTAQSVTDDARLP